MGVHDLILSDGDVGRRSWPARLGRSLGALPKRLWKKLRSLKFAIVLMAAIALACVAGTLIKQEPYDASKAMEAYGKHLGLLIGLLGLHRLYQTAWFLGLLALFALSTVSCALSRRRLRLRSLGSLVVHLSIVFIVAGAIVRGFVGAKGMLAVQEGHVQDTFRKEDGAAPLGFRLRLDDFKIRRYEDDLLLVRLPGEDEPRSVPIEMGEAVGLTPDGTTLEPLRKLPHFKMDMATKRVYSASDRPVNPAIQVRLTGPAGASTRWLFARFPEFDTEGHGHGFHGHGFAQNGPKINYVPRFAPVEAYESHVTVLDDRDEVVREATILVNSPLKVGRYTLYQVDYDHETEQATVLEVDRDPGVPLVFIGFVLMPLGIAFVFYVQPLLRRRERKDV